MNGKESFSVSGRTLAALGVHALCPLHSVPLRSARPRRCSPRSRLHTKRLTAPASVCIVQSSVSLGASSRSTPHRVHPQLSRREPFPALPSVCSSLGARLDDSIFRSLFRRTDYCFLICWLRRAQTSVSTQRPGGTKGKY